MAWGSPSKGAAILCPRLASRALRDEATRTSGCPRDRELRQSARSGSVICGWSADRIRLPVRQREAEDAAAAELRLHADAPAVGLDQRLRDVQPESQALLVACLVVRPVEALEESRQGLRRDPGPLVADRNSGL